MSRRVRISAKRRDDVDIDKLALALLGLIREMESGKRKQKVATKPNTKGGRS